MFLGMLGPAELHNARLFYKLSPTDTYFKKFITAVP